MYVSTEAQFAQMEMEKRQYGYPYYNNGYYSPWYAWGRWVVLAAIIVVFLIIFFTISCINARRRRKQGQRPFTGTGWMAPPPNGAYYGQQREWPTNNQPPSYYQPPPNQGYYGGQQNGYEMASPSNAYQPQMGGEPTYAAPDGPPPSKKMMGDVVR